MSADSPLRRVLKSLLAPILNETTYSHIQAVAKARDIANASWTEPEIDLCNLVLRDGDTAVDIGANFGLWSYHMSRAVGRSGKVYAFEPVPFTATTFGKVARRLGFAHNVDLHEAGCGEKAGEIEFTLPVSESGAIISGLVHMRRDDARPGKEEHLPYGKTRTIRCPVVRLDDELADADRISLLKCDIEGADLFAMRGAKALLERHKPVVVIEVDSWYLQGFGLTVKDLTDFFGGLGYRSYRYDGSSLAPTGTTEDDENNWVFVHPANSERLAAIMPSR